VLLGKLASRGLVGAVSPGALVLITDQLSNRRFLVDTGAAFSVFPYTSASSPSGPALAGAAGQPIPCWGEKQLSLSFGGKAFRWSFLLAAVQFPILGVDFLRHHGLLVDPAGNQLVDRLTSRVFHGSAPLPGDTPLAPQARQPGRLAPLWGHRLGCPASSSSRSGLPPGSPASPEAHRPLLTGLSAGPSAPQEVAPDVSRVKAPSGSRGTSWEAATCGSLIAGILEEFPDVVNADKVLPAAVHGVEHHIVTSGPPIASRFRRLEGAKLEVARREFEAMEREGIIERSTSPWASPLHMVPKKDGSWRPCGDFRRLNLVTEADVYPLPNMLDFSDRLSGCTVFSKIDLRKGYWQIPVRLEDRKKTAVITPFGLFEFTRMPFGSRNAGSSFQRMMDRVLAGLPFAYCYLDNLRIASPDLQSHRLHIRLVFDRLLQFGLVINLEKCVFAVASFEFLGHIVSAQGAQPITSYVEAVEKRPRPTTIKELQVFLGLVNFYRRFLPGVAFVLLPLTDALKGNRPASEPLLWSQEMEAGFVAAKAALAKATWLGHPDPTVRLALHVDASSSHIGAALHQQLKGHSTWQPLGFFSCKLEAAQAK
jgi:hypothetical protein